MSFMLSPGVQVTEKDFTSIVPAVSTSAGAFAGVFRWGPVLDPTYITSETELVKQFGSPNDGTAVSFFSAANFLAYSNNLLVVRADTAGQKNAVATPTGSVTGFTNLVGGTGYSNSPVVTISAPQEDGGVQAEASATVEGGIITGFTITEPGSGYTSATVTITDGTGINADADVTVTVAGLKINNENDYLTNYVNGAGVVGPFAAKYPGTLGNSLKVSMCGATGFAAWTYKNEFNTAPGSTEIHAIIVDEDGLIAGTAGGILEKFAYMSKATNGKYSDGATAYYKQVLNNTSKWIYWMDHPTGMDWGKDDGTGVTFTDLASALTISLAGGTDDYTMTESDQMEGFSIFDNTETYDVSLIIAGKATTTVANHIIQNVAEYRKDCVAFVSPQDTSTGEPVVGIGTDYADDIITYRTALTSSSYAVLDSGYKYQYDRYNDVYRWVPLNADIAGICARTDYTDDPWFSPGGYSRGQVKNVVKLAFNPNQASRDLLYKAGINPVVAFPGQGTVLYGDKTLLAKPSAFDRINVRRLFIVLEKSIATAAKYQLFEFNDTFTRTQFKSMIEPFLRDVQGRRGITDFRVVCDETNNTGEVIDSNRFVADIFIKPARSINFITLNFIAARTAVSFEEIGG